MKVHFIGIGGIGISALAQYYLANKASVSGSDLASSEITKLLAKKGAKIFIGKQKEKNVKQDVDLIIYSPAVSKDNPEIKKAYALKKQNNKIQILSYPQALGILTKKYFTIAVAGTHGKSTTTAMVSLIMKKAKLDPTVIIGTKLKEFNNSNFKMGKSKYLVIEACEHQESFLNYWPEIIILTNIEREHLDFYKNLKNELLGFKKFIGHLSEKGILIANKDDKNIKKILEGKDKVIDLKRVKWFSLKQKESVELKKKLKIPGEHNICNALAALALGRTLKINDKISYKALSEYKGSWRRFEILKTNLSISKNKKKIVTISDYAHHPTEIIATLKGAREKFKNKKICCVFQPHQYQRTFYLFKDFVKIFKEATKKRGGKALIDCLIITDIFDVAGRENLSIKKKVNAKKLVEEINRKEVIYLKKENLKQFLQKNLRADQILIIMGAGDIYKLIYKK